jgi:hypothetical protein
MKRVLAVLAVVVLGAGCAGPASRDEPPTPEETRLAVYQRHAGDSRDEVVFPRVDGWSDLLGEYMAVRTVDDRYFLLTMELACSEDFRVGPDVRIAIEQDTRNTLHRFDQVRIGDRRCRIQQIQPLDAEAIHANLASAGLQDHFIARRVD